MQIQPVSNIITHSIQEIRKVKALLTPQQSLVVMVSMAIFSIITVGYLIYGKLFKKGARNASTNAQKIEEVAKKTLKTPISNTTDSTYTYPTGDVYIGPFVNGKRHGKGQIRYSNGCQDEGTFENDKLIGDVKRTYKDKSLEQIRIQLLESGNVRITYKNGTVYEGNSRDGLRHGKVGITTYADGSSDRGQYNNDELDKTASIVRIFQNKDECRYTLDSNRISICYHNGVLYEGEGKDFKPYGEGTLTIRGATTGEDFVVKGKFEGDAIIEATLPNGNTYKGPISGNGKGTIICSDKWEYKGQCEYFRPKGKGELSVPPGEEYYVEGSFLNEQMQVKLKGEMTYTGPFDGNGEAIIKYSDSSFYTGPCDGYAPYGSGTFTYPDGMKYTGPVDGNGEEVVINYPDGSFYVGPCSGYAPCRSGTFTYPDGMKYTGPVDGNGEVVIKYSDGSFYTGSCSGYAPCGNGTITYPNGRSKPTVNGAEILN